MASPDTHNLPPFLRIPTEIRLQIYDHLLSGPSTPTLHIHTSLPDHHTSHPPTRRSTYNILTTGFFSQSRTTSYRLASPVSLSPCILAVCRQIYFEALPLLYSTHTFDFGSDIEAIAPFFDDLLPGTRRMVKGLNMTKRASWRLREYDISAWAHVCGYLATHCALQTLTLRIASAKLSGGWEEGMHKYSASDFKTLQTVKYEGLEWVRELIKIGKRSRDGGHWDGGGENSEEGLKELIVLSETEHCPPMNSGSSVAIAFFAAFSASLEGFGEYLRAEMLGEHPQKLLEG